MGQKQRAGAGGMVNLPGPMGNRGAVLMLVLVVIFTISIMGAVLVVLFFNVLTLSGIELDRTRALYLSEAGVSMAVSVLKSRAGEVMTSGAQSKEAADGSSRGEKIIPSTELGGGYFEVYNDYAQSTIISIGVSNGVKRVIQLKYSAF